LPANIRRNGSPTDSKSAPPEGEKKGGEDLERKEDCGQSTETGKRRGGGREIYFIVAGKGIVNGMASLQSYNLPQRGGGFLGG